MIKIITGILLLLSILLCNGFCDSWQDTLSGYFDIVETWDNYDDWTPGDLNKDSNFDGSNYAGPVISGTSNSEWDHYNYRDSSFPIAQRTKSLMDFGSNFRVTGKSIAFSYAAMEAISTYEGHVGTFKTQRYFGQTGGGYSEMYFFFRMYLPSSKYPTGIDTNATGGWTNWTTLKHEAGQPYMYSNSYKFLNFGTGFINTRDWKNMVTEESYDTWNSQFAYGDREIWLHLAPDWDAGLGRIAIKPTIQCFQKNFDGGSDGYVIAHGTPIDAYFDKLIGVEIHLKLETVAGHIPGSFPYGDGVVEVWFYDENGTAEKIIGNNSMAFRAQGQDGAKFNRMYWLDNERTNISNVDSYFHCGEGMECAVWVDDIIIDDQLIGPTYYQLLNAEQTQNRGSSGSGTASMR